MNYRVVNCHDEGWTYDEVSRYGRELTAAFKMLAERFPDDVTPVGLFNTIFEGSDEHRLWLVLDENDKFVSFALTKKHTIPATGKSVITITNAAGEDGLETEEAIFSTIEPWAVAQGADIGAIEGRFGWKRIAARHGYEMYAVIYRKHLRQADGR